MYETGLGGLNLGKRLVKMSKKRRRRRAPEIMMMMMMEIMVKTEVQ